MKMIRMILTAGLLLAVILQFIQINRMNRKLKNITILDITESEFRIFNGKQVDKPIRVMTEEAMNRGFVPQSPFADGKSLAELLKEYIKYGDSDKYGAPRRTGNIRRIHEGIDFYVAENTPVYPVFPIGIVTEVSDDPDFLLITQGREWNTPVDSVAVEYGKIVRVLYPEGIESLYAHLNEVFVKEGDLVNRGTILGLTGFTGNIKASGKPSHLHLELRDTDNRSFDPEHRLHYSRISVQTFFDRIIERSGK